VLALVPPGTEGAFPLGGDAPAPPGLAAEREQGARFRLPLAQVTAFSILFKILVGAGSKFVFEKVFF